MFIFIIWIKKSTFWTKIDVFEEEKSTFSSQKQTQDWTLM